MLQKIFQQVQGSGGSQPGGGGCPLWATHLVGGHVGGSRSRERAWRGWVEDTSETKAGWCSLQGKERGDTRLEEEGRPPVEVGGANLP